MAGCCAGAQVGSQDIADIFAKTFIWRSGSVAYPQGPRGAKLGLRPPRPFRGLLVTLVLGR
jgi:hypothetical protein